MSKKITSLTPITGANLVAGDKLSIVDISDLTMAATGTNKQTTLADIAASLPFTQNFTPGIQAAAYGVTADGVTDDTAAWTAAIAAAAAAKKVLYAPVGTSIVSGIQLLTGTTIVGQGNWSSVIKLKNASNAPVISLATDTVQYTYLHNLIIDGNRANQSSVNARGLYYINTDTLTTPPSLGAGGDMYHRVNHCAIVSTYGNGLFIDGRGESQFDHLLFLGCGRGGTGSSAVYVNTWDMLFSNVTIGSSGGHGLQDSGGNNTYTNIKAYLSGLTLTGGGDDFYITSSSNRFSSCVAQGAYRHSLHIDGGVDNIFEGFTAMDPNYTSANGGVCFRLTSANRNKISGIGMKSFDTNNPTPQYLLSISGTCRNNDINLVGEVSDFTLGLFDGSSQGNRVSVNANGGFINSTYAATITPDMSQGSTQVYTLTGNITVNRPINFKDGDRLTMVFCQDVTGGRTVTWGSGFFEKWWQPDGTPSMYSAVEFVCVGTNFYMTRGAVPRTNVQTFTSSGTWTKPVDANYTRAEVTLISGGGGGGSGRRGAAGTVRCGGQAGGNGGASVATFRFADLASTVSVSIGAGGAGGAAVTTNDTNGNNGGGGGSSSFGTLLSTNTSGGGGGGTNAGSNNTQFPSTGSLGLSPNAASPSATGGAGSPGQSRYAVAGAGAGGGITSADVPSAGGAGGVSASITTSAVAGGTAGGGAGANGTAITPGVGTFGGGGGGGGGAGDAAGTIAGGAGGTSSFGAGGAGGGASTNGANSGAGAAGGGGYCVVVCF